MKRPSLAGLSPKAASEVLEHVKIAQDVNGYQGGLHGRAQSQAIPPVGRQGDSTCRRQGGTRLG